MGNCAGKKRDKEITQNNNQLKQGLSTGQTKFSVGPEIFVNLKQGSISSSYKIDKVLGEGQIFKKNHD